MTDIQQSEISGDDSPGDNLTTTNTPQANIVTTGDGDMVIGGFVFTPTALIPVDPAAPPDFENWDAVGQYLRYIHTGTQFWLGDWLNYGENNYGERYAQAVEHTGYELHTLQTYAWVARQVPRSNRLEQVPFGHYANGIAALPPDEQATWAKRVVDENLTQAALRGHLTEARSAKGDRPVDLWLVVKCKSQSDFDKLEKQMRDQGRDVTSRVTIQKKPKADKPKATKKAATVTQKPAGKPKKAKTASAPTLTVTPETQETISRIADDPTLNQQDNIDPGWLKDEFYVPPTANETPDERAKRRKKINNARFRAQQKK